VIACDCGWEGHTAQMARKPLEIDEALEQLFRAHLPPDERQTYLLVDSRRPTSSSPLEQMGEDSDRGAQSPGGLSAQPTIVGTFVMPEGARCCSPTGSRTGCTTGRYRTRRGRETRELPIGEVRTPEGRVFRLDE
jgi:hypothetical protein